MARVILLALASKQIGNVVAWCLITDENRLPVLSGIVKVIGDITAARTRIPPAIAGTIDTHQGPDGLTCLHSCK